MARSEMASLIAELRRMTNAGTADFSVAGSAYYGDDDLQSHLDKFQTVVRRERLVTYPEYSGGSASWYDYEWVMSHVEQYGTATPRAWNLEDENGDEVDTADYSVNYDTRTIRFDSDTRGSARYLSYRSYDLPRAAAAVWREKAAFYAARFDVRIDNHDLKRSQLVQQARVMEQFYLKQATPRQVTLVRTDAN